jgi:sugar phosphate isomerase/epimerase
MPSPTVLLSSAAFFARPLAETCRLAAEAGFGGIEVMVTRDPTSQDPAAIARTAAAHDLTVGALHAPSLLVTRTLWGTDPIGKVRRAVEVANGVGIPVVVTHPPYRWQATYRRWLRDGIADLERRSSVTVAVENMFPLRLGGRSLVFHADQDLDALDGIHHLALDTSHAAVARHNPLEVRRRFGDRLRHVHLSDNAGAGRDSHLPPGEGVVDLDPLLEDLRSGYDGAVTLEVDLRRHLADEGRLLEVMRAMRERVEERLGAPRPAGG